MTGEELALEIRKLLLVEGNMTETQAAKLAGMSQQNFSAKLKSGTLRYTEVAGLLEALDYKIQWRKINRELELIGLMNSPGPEIRAQAEKEWKKYLEDHPDRREKT